MRINKNDGFDGVNFANYGGPFLSAIPGHIEAAQRAKNSVFN